MTTPVEPSVRVTTLELFFDLVVVFTVMQLTDTLADELGWAALGETVLMLALIWWMYSGYAWLTNAMAPSSTFRRTMLLVGMAGFLIIALAIPEAFGETGWAFGVGYLLVTLAHSVLFLHSAGPTAFRAALGFAPLNLVSAGLVLAGGLLPEGQRAAWWGGALVVQFVIPFLRHLGGVSLVAGHFVERHGLIMIIVIGESIVSIGLGFAGVDLDGASLVLALIGLSVAYYFWWAYFAGDDERSAAALGGIADPGAGRGSRSGRSGTRTSRWWSASCCSRPASRRRFRPPSNRSRGAARRRSRPARRCSWSGTPSSCWCWESGTVCHTG